MRYLCVLCHRQIGLLHKNLNMGSLICARILVRAVRTKAGQALTSLHESWLGGWGVERKKPVFFTLSRALERESGQQLVLQGAKPLSRYVEKILSWFNSWKQTRAKVAYYRGKKSDIAFILHTRTCTFKLTLNLVIDSLPFHTWQLWDFAQTTAVHFTPAPFDTSAYRASSPFSSFTFRSTHVFLLCDKEYRFQK